MNTTRRSFLLDFASFPAILISGAIAQDRAISESNCSSKIPANFPPPKFGFGAKVRHKIDGRWKEGQVIGIIWNVEASEWEFQVHWDEDDKCLAYI